MCRLIPETGNSTVKLHPIATISSNHNVVSLVCAIDKDIGIQRSVSAIQIYHSLGIIVTTCASSHTFLSTIFFHSVVADFSTGKRNSRTSFVLKLQTFRTKQNTLVRFILCLDVEIQCIVIREVCTTVVSKGRMCSTVIKIVGIRGKLYYFIIPIGVKTVPRIVMPQWC